MLAEVRNVLVLRDKICTGSEYNVSEVVIDRRLVRISCVQICDLGGAV